MDRSTLVRRAFHLTSPVWLVWYWTPPDAWVGVRKEGVLVLFLSAALLIEAGRLIFRYEIPGMRDYETDRLSAYAWGSLGLTLGLLFFGGELVIPVFWGMAWIDPLCGHGRREGYPLIIPWLSYLVLASIVSAVVVPFAPYQTTPLATGSILLLMAIAGSVAVAVERPNLRHVDDDFLMTVAPLLVLAALTRILPVY